ncbi:sialoadhesin-like [Myxocyprinus asiaticus]|uniref:sialoadhesin-like n=1 Tax=Myxocyprinus asiaticus TaxID=70543 RepID=UPI002221F20B|nr:sialoadhesin-like [Myxocyprinus asiaticus]XP_051579254.1 sialoadhesin-like [Myxocyprinus asiaticus]XP_051579255.1 sialoadhesin-like [Myxocyprinus asiaticus]
MDIWTAEKIILLSFLLKGVWCVNLTISLPEKVEALSGSCVLIKCKFKIDTIYERYFTDRAKGTWSINGTQKMVLNSSMSNANPKGSIIGNFSENNCTTIFYDINSSHSGTYYLMISADLRGVYSCASVIINVIDSPPKPTVKILGQSEVFEGSSVSMSCSAKVLCSSRPPTLTWSSTPRLPLSRRSRIQEQQNQPELISNLNFTATYLQHSVTFTCTITYQLQDKNKSALNSNTLYVQYAPKISLSPRCSGTDVTICFCEVHGNPSPKVTWYLSGRPVTNSTCLSISEERLDSTVLRSSLTLHYLLTVKPTLQCVAINTHGNASQQFPLFPPPQETAQCQQITVWFLIILTLILLLYALTFGFGLYKIRQLSAKLKAKEVNVYSSLQLSSPNSVYENLNITRDTNIKRTE